MVSIRHDLHEAKVQQMLRSPTGGVGRDMLKRGIRVQAAAKRNLAGGASGPKRIDTGLLRSSVYSRPIFDGGVPGARVGSDLRYAKWVHDGTGVYGPRHAPIRPVRARMLRFKPKGATRYVYARQVRGMKPNRFLKDALRAARI